MPGPYAPSVASQNDHRAERLPLICHRLVWKSGEAQTHPVGLSLRSPSPPWARRFSNIRLNSRSGHF